jgi:hypothetical protein
VLPSLLQQNLVQLKHQWLCERLYDEHYRQLQTQDRLVRLKSDAVYYAALSLRLKTLGRQEHQW